MHYCIHQASSSFSDNFWPALCAGIISTGLGFWGAMHIFIRSLKNEKVKEKEHVNEELLEILRFLDYSMQGLVEPEKELINSLDGFTKQLKARKVEDIVFTYKTAFNFDWLEGIDKIKLQKIFLTKLKGDEKERINQFNRFLSNVVFINTINKRLNGDFMYYIEESRKLESLFNVDKVRILQLLEPIIAKINGARSLGIESNIFLTTEESELMKIFSTWMELKDSKEKADMFKFYDEVFLDDRLLQLGWKTENFGLINSIRNIMFAFDSYQKIRGVTISMFESYRNNIDKSFKEIQDTVSKYSAE